jgi:hypothetical protein
MRATGAEAAICAAPAVGTADASITNSHTNRVTIAPSPLLPAQERPTAPCLSRNDHPFFRMNAAVKQTSCFISASAGTIGMAIDRTTIRRAGIETPAKGEREEEDGFHGLSRRGATNHVDRIAAGVRLRGAGANG